MEIGSAQIGFDEYGSAENGIALQLHLFNGNQPYGEPRERWLRESERS